mmetsp:Transcript_6423/g.8443  ORF Transcript_6423/g.8443 Transcript_6423/m.8443 type:complete len:289 (-) Transcript_6423:360-1226(-)
MNKVSALTFIMAAGSAAAFQPVMIFGGKKASKSKPIATKEVAAPEPKYTGYTGKPQEGRSLALPWVKAPTIADGQLVGDVGFDPLGLSKTFDISWLRAAELKHGRVCMLAAVGLIAPELVQNPVGFDGFSFPPEFQEMNAIKALSTVPQFGVAQIILACGLAEISSFGKIYSSDFGYDDNLTPKERENIRLGKREALAGSAFTAADTGYFSDNMEIQKSDPTDAGNLGFDPLGFADAGVNPDYALAEIKHARLAMIGTLGMLLQAFNDPSKGVAQGFIEWFSAKPTLG